MPKAIITKHLTKNLISISKDNIVNKFDGSNNKIIKTKFVAKKNHDLTKFKILIKSRKQNFKLECFTFEGILIFVEIK